MKLLSICVPTYNRNQELSFLLDSFLKKVVQNYSDLVNVHIFDNSDEDYAVLNAKEIGEGISYHKNPTNVGFFGNIINCISVGDSKYTWTVSDNDGLLIEMFDALLRCLKRCDEENISALILPYQLFINGEDHGPRNLPSQLSIEPVGVLHDALQCMHYLPFILFSTVIVKTAGRPVREIVDAISRKFNGNDYVQIPLYLSVVPHDGRYCFFSDPIIQYHEEIESRFNFPRLVPALNQIIAWAPLEERSRISVRKNHYRNWIMWLLKHRIGRVRVRNAKELQVLLIKEFWQNKSLKAGVLLMLSFLPGRISERFIGNRI